MDFTGKKALIYGMGISGKGAAELLGRAGVPMVLYDRNEELDKEALKEDVGAPRDTKVILGDISDDDLEGIDIMVLSPGVSVNAPIVQKARKKGIRVLGELETAYEFSKGDMIAITGTNGKTTTTALTGEIMKAAFDDVFVVGNIGISFAKAADKTLPGSVIVAEVSSFQLETIEEFHPRISAVLNLTPDHLDRHGSFENYAKCKMDIARNQLPTEKCIINYDDRYLRDLSDKITPEPLYFSRLEELDKGVYLKDGVIVYSDGEKTVPVIKRSDIKLMGDHNVENVMAAIGLSISAGVNIDTIAEVIRNFKAVEHRIEYVCEKNGVIYYNDSKGTNTDASSKAIESMTAPTILIAGGYDKGADFTEWVMGFNGKVKELILIGKTAEKIKAAALDCGFNDIHMAGELDNAVNMAAGLAKQGDAVLLSPACASWDQFSGYEQRGRVFKELVNNL